jgi:S1-C subfamily serine protease
MVALRSRKWWIVAIVLQILTSVGNASVLDNTDYERIHNLVGKALQLERDILDVEHGSRNVNERDCLDGLFSNVEIVQINLGALSRLVYLSTQMADYADEQIVLGELGEEGRYFTKFLELQRKRVNEWASCSESNVTPIKAHEILAFYGQALSLVTAVLGKIDAHSQQSRPGNEGHSEKNNTAISRGTGFAVTANGALVTNEHVVSGCVYVTVRQGPPEFTGRVESSDQVSDLAVVRISRFDPPSFSEKGAMFGALRQSPPLKAGEQAISYGFPLSGALATEGNLTVGNVSALHGLGDDPREIQVTTPVQAGNSGGPLLDHSGNIIGVTAAKLNAVKVLGDIGDLPQNVNFAVNLETLKAFLSQNKISATEAPSRDELNPSEIGDRAKLFTYLIECDPRSTVSEEPSKKGDRERWSGTPVPRKTQKSIRTVPDLSGR